MRILAIKNAKNEELEYIEDILVSQNLEFDYIMAKELDKDDIEDLLGKYTHVVILGGPQGVYEAEEHPYLKNGNRIDTKCDQLKKASSWNMFGGTAYSSSLWCESLSF